MSIFSENLKKIRMGLNLNQFEFAKLIGLDVTKKKIETRISNWEKGRGIPELETIINIAKAGEVSLDWLFLSMDTDKRNELLIEENLKLKKELKEYKLTVAKDKKILSRVAEQLEDFKKE